jgi:hypothetical protein
MSQVRLVLSLCTIDTATLRETLPGPSITFDLEAFTVTGGRLNVNNALHAAPPRLRHLTASGQPVATRVTLTWPGVFGAMRYNVKRSWCPAGCIRLGGGCRRDHVHRHRPSTGRRFHCVVSAENSFGENGD